MAKVDITETTLPNGKIGNVGYISLSEDTKMTVYSDYLINNKIYTLSFYAKNTSTEGTLLEIIDGIRDGIATYLVTQEWNKVKLTFISNGKNVVVYFPSSDYYLYELKLEEGNVATTWTPSENDTKAETLQSATIQYYKSTNATSMIGGEWSTVTPTWESGYYIWTRTMFIHQDGSVLYSNPACITGEKGDRGDNGTNGTNGTDGISIISVTPIYYCTDDLINPPTTSTLPTEKVTTDSDTAYGTWNLRPATWTTSYKYYFICSQIEYSDGTIGFSSIVQDNSLSKCVAEIITNTNDIGLKVSKGGSIADINASVASGQSEVKISADAISLEGVVTANETFKIETDGSMEATGGKIGGLEIIDNGFRGSGFELEQAEILFDDDNTLPIIKKQSCLRLEGVTDQYGWNTTSKVEYSGNGVKSNYVDITINKSAFDLEILPIRKVGRNSVDAKIKFHTLYYKGIEDATETISLDGSTGEVKGRVIKTYAGADLDAVKAKADGSLKSTHIGHATGTSSAFPSVDISSIKDGTIMRIEVGIPIDNTSTQTMAWFSTTVKKSTSTADYLYNCGGYYYSANYNASVFINVSSTRVTINDAWTKAIGGANASAVNNLKSKATIYVYTENL